MKNIVSITHIQQKHKQNSSYLIKVKFTHSTTK